MHLNNCKTHQSYYSCLSRSATHEGTLILHGFNSQTIQNGLSGHLRQEFRELEVLDDITKLRYESVLPNHGEWSSTQRCYNTIQTMEGDNYIPTKVHAALKWSHKSPFILGYCDDAKWKIVNSKRNAKIKPLPLPVGHKKVAMYTPVHSNTLGIKQNNKSPALPSTVEKKTKKQHIHLRNYQSTSNGISYNNQCSTNAYNTSTNARNSSGIKWDSQDYSCAYDSLFTILWNMWSEDHPLIESQAASMWNNYFYTLVNGFPHHHSHQTSLEDVRNTVRNQLRHQNSAAFPFGNYGVDIKDLLNMMFKYSSYPPIVMKQHFA